MEEHTSGIGGLILTKDEKELISWSGDNTIRIWSTDTGKLLATLVAFNNSEGIVYTPDGRFDYTSNKAQDYVTYKVGNEIIDFADIHEKYYTPGLLKKVLSGEKMSAYDYERKRNDLLESFKNRPKIQILKDEGIKTEQKIAKDDEAEIFFNVKDTGGGISEILVLVNGRPVENEIEESQGSEKSIYVPLAYGENRIEIKAFNTKGMPRTERVYLRREIPENVKAPKPNLYVLSVGINKYKQNELHYCVEDAKSIAKAIQNKSKGLFQEIKVKMLLDEEATRSNIQTQLEEITKLAKPEDVVVLYFSGHGNTVAKKEGGKLFYYLPSDFHWKNTESEEVAKNAGIDAEYLSYQLGRMRPHKVVLILDSCHSGDVAVALASRSSLSTSEQLERLANGTGRFLFTSAAGTEEAREIKDIGHGLFTYVLLHAFGEIESKYGNADVNQDGAITMKEIDLYIDENFNKLTKPYLKDFIQTPYVTSLGRDGISARVNGFPLVMTKK